MDRRALSEAIERTRTGWEAAIAELGDAGLERAGAVGRWRVRDVLAHFNGWDRWQLVQLRSAFTGEVPEESELLGGLDIGEPDPSLPFDDGMNACFEAANRDRPVSSVVDDWRAMSATRAAWVDAASDDQLDALVGADWNGEPGRYIRLVSEVEGADDPKPAGEFVMDQVEHQREHLAEVRDWMGRLP